MKDGSSFKMIKSCEAKYAADEAVKYVVFSTSKNLFLGIVMYLSRQVNAESIDNAILEKHFPSVSELQAVTSCEDWIRENINDDFSIHCVQK